MNKFENYTFTVRNVRGVSLDEALRLWKTSYSTFKEFLKNVIIYESLEELLLKPIFHVSSNNSFVV